MAAPSPLWYATRGLGMVLFIVLTANVAVGIMITQRWRTPGSPGFVVVGLHRNVALLALPLLALHGLTVILDPFAGLGLKDITVPFASSYRPFWLGLGVLSGELLMAVVATSLLRARIGLRAWRVIHWLAYVSWPLALLHGLGTGSDSRGAWALAIYAACLAAVAVAVGIRLLAGEGGRSGWRRGMALLGPLGIVAVLAWALAGPMQPGWAAAAGTPKRLIAGLQSPSPRPDPSPAPAGIPTGLDDQLSVSASQSGGSLVLNMVDRSDSSIQLVLTVPSQTATSGPLVVRVGGRLACRTQATLNEGATASCGGTQLQIVVEQSEDGSLSGRLTTGPRG